MNKKEFESFIELKIRDIIALTIERENLSFEESLQYAYESKLYAGLLTKVQNFGI